MTNECFAFRLFLVPPETQSARIILHWFFYERNILSHLSQGLHGKTFHRCLSTYCKLARLLRVFIDNNHDSATM